MLTAPWFRVYSSRGERLLVQAVDHHDARERALARWRNAGVWSSFAEVRTATGAELEEHFASIAGLERCAWHRPPAHAASTAETLSSRAQ